MKSEKQLREELVRTLKALDTIEGERQRKANRNNLGKCFKYENGYGDGHKWPLYLRITRVGRHMRGHKFERTSSDRFEARHDTYVTVDGWKEIPRSELQRAWVKFVKGLKALNG